MVLTGGGEIQMSGIHPKRDESLTSAAILNQS